MIVTGITEVSLIAVLDRGVPNKESIALEVNEETDLGQFGVMLGIATSKGFAKPIHDKLFWFGDGLLQPGDWIFVNTGDGEPRLSKTHDGLHDIYSLFWKKSATLFANTNIVPILFKVCAVAVLDPPSDLPQLGK